MKQSLLFLISILYPILCFSQMYKVDEQRIYEWDEAIPDWKQITTRHYTYDNGGTKETNLLVLAFPSGDNLFQEKKSYNANNNVTLNIMQFWNPNPPGAWQNTSQIMYDYDGANKLITETTQTYFSVWENAYRTVYEYDGDDLEKETTYFYNSGTMMFELTNNSTRELYAYSGSGVDIQTSQHYVSGTGWVDDEIYKYTYVSPGVISTVIDSTWNASTNMWDIERGTAIYNMGLLAKIEYHVPDGIGGWDLDSQTIFEYNNDGLEEKRTDQDWDGSSWVDIDRELNSYDGNGNNTVSIYENANMGIWVGFYKEEKDYSIVMPFSLTAKSIVKLNLKVYPNPASNHINIISSTDIERVDIFDVLGEKIKSISNLKRIHVETLNVGVYIMKFFSNDVIITKKVIIKK